MTKIIQRHDTAANWASANPVLAQGEMGIEDDTRKFKFGDGTTAWADLPYASSEGGGGIATTNTAGIVKPDGTTISVTEDGTISSVPPANMITSDNIASNATIVGMNNAIEMAQGDITTLNETVLPTKTNKVQAAQASMPSSNSMDLTIGSSGTSYTAPANGWFSLDAWTSSTSVSYVALHNTTTDVGYIAVPNQGGSYQQRLYVPAHTGDNVLLNYGNLNDSKPKTFKFIYAEGEV